DIGVLHLLEGEGPSPTGPSISATLLLHEAWASFDDSLSIIRLSTSGLAAAVSISATSEAVQVVGLRTVTLPWLVPASAEVYRFQPARPSSSRDYPPGSGVITVTIPLVVADFTGLLDWTPCELPLRLEPGEHADLAIALAPWVETLAGDFFLYVPVEVELRSNGLSWTAKLTGHDGRWERPWEMFQTIVRPVVVRLQ
ncbi:MAG: hypothetical protein Q8P31_12305, partial [Bacillota bacterium]|nr:hypothetical protein [Bacillota bacterium]